ncbi:MAG: aspartate carbamoyltransferase regulatory subunit [Firmicutes bacterium]|nr:aspartate carbamoyltransferase regulatory subunit [Bacillota bacterium]MCD7943578.1 aspartate carbamoyltransferase regulatory subunit [Clostridia bacterium]MCD8002867.1 aspartate carbamoyltransferase regulatory subunit [Clostridia bacterium]MCD8055498.1 aspartate carbamoyltransferase regulatory subunit [Clostridiales bacterium]
MNIDAIKNGYVIDHISAGRGMELYTLLGLDRLDCSVAIIKNAQSAKYGRKDIIKIDGEKDVNLDLIGYFDPNITINVIRDGECISKGRPELPKRLVGVLTCKNPRCITTTEQELPQIFKLTDRETREYRCIYCETKAPAAGKSNG